MDQLKKEAISAVPVFTVTSGTIPALILHFGFGVSWGVIGILALVFMAGLSLFFLSANMD